MKNLRWLAGTCAIGFALPYTFADLADLERGIFLAPYMALGSAWCLLLLRSTGFSWSAELRQSPRLMLVVSLLAVVLMVIAALREPPSAPPGGLYLVATVLWSGVLYGLVDATLLTVAPVRLASVTTSRWRPALALGASLLVTASYHLGYPSSAGPPLPLPF